MPDEREAVRGYRCGSDGPSSEAYSRVTNPERFAPLHDFTAELLSRLERDYEVERTEGCDLDAELGNVDGLVCPVVLLMPTDEDASPITVAFSNFPGLFVHFGAWVTMSFPSCRGHACAESVEDEIERLQVLVDDVVGGRYRESIHIPEIGPARRQYQFESCESGSARLERDEALQLLASGPASYEWKAWRRR